MRAVRTDDGAAAGERPPAAGPVTAGLPKGGLPKGGLPKGGLLGEVRPPRRGRPRSEAAERAIIEGVLHLLEEGSSLRELSIERIAKVAGVGKATIYRRWPGKEALLVDVLAALESVPPPPRQPGASVREDLLVLIEWIRRRGLTKRDSALLRTVAAEFMRHPTLSRQYHEAVIEPRRELMREVLRRGVQNGELRDDLDIELLAELFTGPMVVRAVLHEWAPLDEELPAQIVDAVLEGVRKR